MITIKRLQLFEFCDQPWLPEVIRDIFHNGLATIEKAYGLFYNFPQILNRLSARINSSEILDLCSGGGGLVSNFLQISDKQNLKLPKIILSDLYPDKEKYELLQKKYGAERIGYIETSLNALSEGKAKANIDMMCFGFHHMNPQRARVLINRVVENKKSLIITEGFQRNIVSLLLYLLFAPLIILGNMLLCLYSAPLKLNNILFSIFVPVAPLILYFDGFVSILRTYTFSEIMTMIPEEARQDYYIEYGYLNNGSLIQSGYYFSLLKK